MIFLTERKSAFVCDVCTRKPVPAVLLASKSRGLNLGPSLHFATNDRHGGEDSFVSLTGLPENAAFSRK